MPFGKMSDFETTFKLFRTVLKMRTLSYKSKEKANGSQIYGPLQGKELSDGEMTLMKSA